MGNRHWTHESEFNKLTVGDFLAELPDLCELLDIFPEREYYVENGKIYMHIVY